MKNIDDKLFDCFKDVANKIHNLHKELLNHFGLNLSQLKIINILEEKKELLQTELSDACLIDKPATSRIVNKMSDCGLIQKSSKKDNRKNIYVSLSESGKKLADKIKEKLKSLKLKCFEKLEEKDKNMFFNLLEKTLKGESNA